MNPEALNKNLEVSSLILVTALKLLENLKVKEKMI